MRVLESIVLFFVGIFIISLLQDLSVGIESYLVVIAKLVILAILLIIRKPLVIIQEKVTQRKDQI
jgi:hypothetical protein